jgi:hypothetical protein
LISDLKLMLLMRAFTYTNKEFLGLTPNHAIDDQAVAKVAVSRLIERASKTNSWLHGGNPTRPLNLLHHPLSHVEFSAFTAG